MPCSAFLNADTFGACACWPVRATEEVSRFLFVVVTMVLAKAELSPVLKPCKVEYLISVFEAGVSSVVAFFIDDLFGD